MRVDRVVLLLAVGLSGCAVHCSQAKNGAQDIPPRCRQVSVTPVSCAQHTPDSLLPHPDDCELFYYCVSPDARPICRQCPARLHFNPRLHVCDHPEVAGCRGPRPTLDTTEQPTEATTTEEGYETVTYYDYGETATTGASTSGSWWWWG